MNSLPPLNLPIQSWSEVKPYFDHLLEKTPNSLAESKAWLLEKSNLEATLEEDGAWRYIRMTVDTSNEAHQKAYEFFLNEIAEPSAPLENQLQIKSLELIGWEELKKDPAYLIYWKRTKSQIEIYRDINVPLETRIQEKAKVYGTIVGAQNIEHGGKTLTMPQAFQLLKDTDESVRKSVFEKIYTVRSKDIDKLDELFDELLQIRHEVAQNAGFKNYLEYKFVALNRFDYTPQDCLDFHESVKKHLVPVVRDIQRKKCALFGVSKLKPWNTEIDPKGRKPLKPFESGTELIEKSKEVFKRTDPFFAQVLDEMQHRGFLDVESKSGKAPGGYNYPLYLSGYPFIFMNAAGSQRDLVTMIHEGGHAVHSVLTKDLKLTSFKDIPSEVAELASMSMELLTMEHWDVFYGDSEDLVRAKIDHLEDLISVLPWIATIDSFQFWLYQNPGHTREERQDKWLELMAEYGNDSVDYTGFENSRKYAWQKQLHLFEVPFYYIEYGFAQLGALQVYRNYLKNKDKAIEQYKTALGFGYTRSIPELYESAGIHFDFGAENIQTLATMVRKELDDLEAMENSL